MNRRETSDEPEWTREHLYTLLDGYLEAVKNSPRVLSPRSGRQGYYWACRKLRDLAGREEFIQYVRRYQEIRLAYKQRHNILCIYAQAAAAVLLGTPLVLNMF